MTREFIMLPEFERKWKEIGLNDASLSLLQQQLCLYPESGAVMRGTGGLRKLRFALEGRGKSGSARAVYVDFAYYEKIYLITAYTKDERDNLTPSECAAIKKLIESLKNELGKKG